MNDCLFGVSSVNNLGANKYGGRTVIYRFISSLKQTAYLFCFASIQIRNSDTV